MIPRPPTQIAGARLIAGLGFSTVYPDIDFETYSEAGYVWNEAGGNWVGPPGSPANSKGLTVIGSAKYAADPSTEILSMAYDLKDGLGRRHWHPWSPPPEDLFAHVRAGGPLEAWNVAFERWIWEEVCVKRMGWPAVQMHQWRCAMAKARANCYPGSLGAAGQVMNLRVQKDKDGDRLLKKFSMPQKPTKAQPLKRIRLQDDWDDACNLFRYNLIDIESEAEASAVCEDLDPEEFAYWQADQAINHRGVAMDRASIEACISIVEQTLQRYNAELHAITGIDAASKTQQLQGWLKARGVSLASMDEEAVSGALDKPELTTIIAGSRSVTSAAAVADAAEACGWKITAVVSGCAAGVDTLGAQWAYANDVPVDPMPAAWELDDGTHDSEAGFARNDEMAERAQALIAIWDGVSRGTLDMITRMQARGKRVYLVSPHGAQTLNGLPADARRVLEIRAAAGSSSVKKVFAMRNTLAHRDRIYDLFMYHAARTGRATGDGPQPTNLPKAGPNVMLCGQQFKGKFVEGSGCGRYFGKRLARCAWCNLPVPPVRKANEWSPKAAEDALAIIASHSLDLVELVYGKGQALQVVAGCLRGLFVAAEGHDLVSSDYTAIEAVVLAAIAGEKWRLDVFNTHGMIYEASASTAFRVPLEEFKAHKDSTGQHHPLRQKGKGLELGCGYQGWIGAARQFGVPGSDDELSTDILAWRAASPSIVWIWGGQTLGAANGIRMPHDRNARWDRTPFYFGTEGAVVQACLTPGTRFPVTRLDGTDTGLSYLKHGSILYCILPSGRTLKYHNPQLEPSDRGGLAFSYEGYNTNPKNGPRGWIRMRSWGGRFVENWDQAIARDILRRATLNLEARGYPVVLHVYDELVCEVPKGFGSVEETEAIMTALPDWAAGWPIKAAGGWRGYRYRKG